MKSTAFDPADAPVPGRPSLFVIVNSLPPYRIHLHRRLVRELTDFHVWTVSTHDSSSDRWGFDPPPEINPVRFGPGDEAADQGKPGHALHNFKKGGRIIRWIDARRPAAVLLMGYNDPGRLRILHWCDKSRVPCFVWGDSNIQGDRATGIKAVVKSALLRWVVRRAAVVMPCGSLGAAFFKKYGASDEQIILSPYEPDYELIRALPAETLATVAARFGLEPGRRRIVFSGRLVAVKRVDLAIAAFVAIAAERPMWDLIVIGDGELRHGLEAAVPAPMRGRVKFLGFEGDQAVVSAVYRQSDVLVLPSDYEPWALVINEAVAAGMAVVSSDVVGAAAELVRDDVNGKTFRAGDLTSLTAALRRVTDETRIEGLKKNAAGVLEDWRRRADPVEGVRRALAAHPPTA